VQVPVHRPWGYTHTAGPDGSSMRAQCQQTNRPRLRRSSRSQQPRSRSSRSRARPGICNNNLLAMPAVDKAQRRLWR
jgi:hypothetical protein